MASENPQNTASLNCLEQCNSDESKWQEPFDAYEESNKEENMRETQQVQILEFWSYNMTSSTSKRKRVASYSSGESDEHETHQLELFFQQGEDDKMSDDCDYVDLEGVRRALAYMIIVDGLPFRQVEKPGFKYFVSVMCPRFPMPSRATIAHECYLLYKNEKDKLKDFLKTCQSVSVTIDTWTSISQINYMCLTLHFIDNDWKLQKKIISFCPIASYKGEAIGKAVETCLKYWEIEDKLFTVTIDNASSNDVACAHLRKVQQRKVNCVGDGKYIHIRCITHIINLIVWDVIKKHSVCIDRIRNAVQYVENSPSRMRRFEKLVSKHNIDSKCSLCFDNPTRWDSIYTMLSTALKFQLVFGKIFLHSRDKESEMLPGNDDWKKVERLVAFLKSCYLLTRQISGSLYLTSSKGFFEIAAVYDMLNKWEENVDPEFRDLACSIKKKFDKYWGNVGKMNMLIYVAAILDPRYKWVPVELTFIEIYGEEKGMKLGTKVKDFTYALFNEYKSKYSHDSQPDDSSIPIDLSENGMLENSYWKTIKKKAKMLEGSSEYDRSELDRYFIDRLGPTEKRMDALAWWGKFGQRYPILSHMARDILAIPLSTVSAESAFSAGGRHLEPFKSSLTPKLVQALICTQDWLRTEGVVGVDLEKKLFHLKQWEKDLCDVDDEVMHVDT